MIALIQTGFDIVADYFRTFSTDASWTGSIVIPPAQILRPRLNSFGDLLDALLGQIQRGERDILIACHGNPNGLPLPLVPGTPVTANHDLLAQLNQLARGRRELRAELLGIVDDRRRRRVFQTERQLDDLVDLIRRVQQGGLGHIEFRCCNLGAGPGLRAVHDILGAEHTVAPTVLFVWTSIATGGIRGTTAQFQRRVQRLGFPQRLFSRLDCLVSDGGGHDDEIALGMSVQVRADGRPGRLNFDAMNHQAIKGWTQYYLENFRYWPVGQVPPGGGYRLGGRLPLIGLWDGNNNDRPVLFPGDGFHYLEKLAVENTPRLLP